MIDKSYIFTDVIYKRKQKIFSALPCLMNGDYWFFPNPPLEEIE